MKTYIQSRLNKSRTSPNGWKCATTVFMAMLTAIALVSTGAFRMQAQTLYSYDPALATPPESQGFAPLVAQAPAPVFANGVLHTFQADLPDGTQYWYRTNAPLDFSITSYRLEAKLRVISANYLGDISGQAQRSGYYLTAADLVGRQFAVGISSDGITINTDANFQNTQGVQFKPFDSTDAFHTYSLIIEGGMGTLYIDGASFASTAVGDPGVVPPEWFNKVGFGDASGQGASEAELRQFRLVFQPATPTLDLHMYAGLTVTGSVGAPYQIQYQDGLGNTHWLPLADFILPASPYFFVDTNSPHSSQRFYRAVPNP